MDRYFLGLDLGGTNIKAALVSEKGKLLHKVSIATGAPREKGADLSPRAVTMRMAAAADQVLGEAGMTRQNVVAAGIGAPGQIVTEKGIILRSANLPAWKNTPLRADVSKRLGMPAMLENDAKAAAYGEWWAGAGAGGSGKHSGSLFIFTLGTGVGGGLISGGKVVHGDSDFAGEVGHTIAMFNGEPCPCGQRGCLERYCSASAVGRRAGELLAQSAKLRKNSTLGALHRKAGAVTAAEIAAHARAGDKLADAIWDETCSLLAAACINVCRLTDPSMIVLAGGMSKAGPFLLNRVRKHFRAQWWKMTRPTATIALARLGNDAGAIGAAGVAKAAFDRQALPPIGR